jgi:SPOR domain
MVQGGHSKRRLGDVWPQLLLSACVLLVPPLLMSAGVMYLGSSPPQGPEQHVPEQQGTVSAAERVGLRPDGGTSFALASIGQHLVIAERRPVVEGPTEGTQNQTAKDPTRYAQIGAGSERSVVADVKTPRAADIPEMSVKIPEQVPAVKRPTRAATPLPVPRPPVAALEESPPGIHGPVSHANENGSWVVQLSVLKTEAEAGSAFRAIQRKYPVLSSYQPLIRKKDRGERGVFYAAQVGPLPREEADQLCGNLKSAGGSCFIQKN